MKRTSILVLGLGLLLLGAGCQKQPTVTTNTSRNTNVPATNTAATNTAVVNTIDPCSFLTQAEAEAVFGKAAKAPEARGTACRYDTVDATKFFDLTTENGTPADFENRKNLCDTAAQPVTGLGPTSCSANNTVVVLKNNVLLTLVAGGVFDQGQLQGLAVTAASRIP